MIKNNFEKGFALPAMLGILALILVIGGVAYVATREPEGAMERAEDVMEKEGEMVEGDAMTTDNDGAMMEGEAMESGVEGAMTEGETMTKFTGAVLAGTTSVLLDFKKADYDAALKADKLVVLYFYATWCPICRAEFPKMQAAFDKLDGDQVMGFRVNYNDDETDPDEKELAREFGVAYQHTKVFIKGGERILKSPESWNEARYSAEISKALAQ
jgi:thiol-disulfide isomerase/thioredoxin